MRGYRRVAILASMAAAAVMISPTPASAVGEGYIDADPGSFNDWGDEGPLGPGSYPTAQAVGLWQNILYIEGRLDLADIDCVFGPRTVSATRAFNNYYLGVGGQSSYDNALQASFAVADNYLAPVGTWTKNSDYEVIEYSPPFKLYPGRSGRRFVRYKSDHGAYWFHSPRDDVFHKAVYGSGASRSSCV